MYKLEALGLAIAILVSGCGHPTDNAFTTALGKVDGPDVKSLSHEQLMAVIRECHQYGSSDDPKVRYTVHYCSNAQSAHAMEGYSTPNSAVVDPKLNKMH